MSWRWVGPNSSGRDDALDASRHELVDGLKQEQVDVAIVGGGMVGVSTALHCLEHGLTVTLIDGGDTRRRASYGNAGAISRGSIFPVASPSVMKGLFRYATNRDPGLRIDHARMARIWPWVSRFLRSANEASWRTAARALDPFVAEAFAEHAQLAERAGATGLITRLGWIKAYRSDEGFAGSGLERSILAEYGVKVDILDGAALRELEPAIRRPFAKALLFPETGHVRDPGGLLAAYEALFLAQGGAIVRADATALRPGASGWSIVAGQTIEARKAVLAAGAWSDALSRSLGYAFPMAAERGYHRHFAPRSGPALTRTIYDAAAGYVAAPMNQGIRILSGIELAPRDAPPDTRQIERCIEEARGTLDLGAPVENSPWLGSRPSTPDGLPIIGPASRHDGLFFAFGHGHIGLSTGPITGRIVADLITGRQPHLQIGAFSPKRFGG